MIASTSQILTPDDIAVANAVASLKASIDATLTNHLVNNAPLPRGYLAPFVPPYQKRAAIDPKGFIEAVLPYSSAHYSSSAPYELVNPFCVISGTYDNYPNLAPRSAMRLFSELNADSMAGIGDVAYYARITGTSLYVALEGKNRVSLYRHYRRLIGARVHEVPFPADRNVAIENLRLHQVRPFGHVALSRPLHLSAFRDYSWAHKQRAYAILPFPDAIVPLLMRCGIPFGDSVWKLSSWRHYDEGVIAATRHLMMN